MRLFSLIFLVRLVVTSATQVGFLQALGHEGDIVLNTGSDMQLPVEQIIRVKPDYILLTDYGFEVGGAKQIERSGIPIVWFAEWKENDPLARAAWLRKVAELVGEQQKADSILAAVTANYNRLSSLASKQAPLLVLSGQNYRGTWNVPTTDSFMGRLITAAGGQVAEGKGSLALSVEEAIRRFVKADVWIGTQVETYADLDALDAKHTWVRARKNNKVYNWNRVIDEKGVSDFWVTGVYRPDLILSDLIWAFRPELIPGYKPAFIQPLK